MHIYRHSGQLQTRNQRLHQHCNYLLILHSRESAEVKSRFSGVICKCSPWERNQESDFRSKSHFQSHKAGVRHLLALSISDAQTSCTQAEAVAEALALHAPQKALGALQSAAGNVVKPVQVRVPGVWERRECVQGRYRGRRCPGGYWRQSQGDRQPAENTTNPAPTQGGSGTSELKIRKSPFGSATGGRVKPGLTTHCDPTWISGSRCAQPRGVKPVPLSKAIKTQTRI